MAVTPRPGTDYSVLMQETVRFDKMDNNLTIWEARQKLERLQVHQQVFQIKTKFKAVKAGKQFTMYNAIQMFIFLTSVYCMQQQEMHVVSIYETCTYLFS